MRILWLKTELLHPVERGGRIRTYQMLRELAREHEVTYLALDDGKSAPDAHAKAAEYSSRAVTVPFHPTSKTSWRLYADLLANLASPLPYAIAKYQSSAFRQQLLAEVRSGAHDVVVCDFLAPSQNVPSSLGVPMVLFQHNVEAAIWQRHAAVATSVARSAYFGLQARRMQRFERAECHRFDQTIAVSEQDAAVFRTEYGCRNVSWVPTGVDTQFFTATPDHAREPGLMVFTGAMDWMPNEDAMAFFCAEVFPRVKAEVPHARLEIVGREPSAQVRRLHDPAAGVHVVGTVPDVRPYMARCSAFVVPIRIGGGTRLKIYEAMASGCSVVTTRVGAEGLPLTDVEHVRFADTADQLVRQVVHVLRDADEARQMAARGDAYVRREFGWNAVAGRFSATCAEVVARVKARTGSLQESA